MEFVILSVYTCFRNRYKAITKYIFKSRRIITKIKIINNIKEALYNILYYVYNQET